MATRTDPTLSDIVNNARYYGDLRPYRPVLRDAFLVGLHRSDAEVAGRIVARQLPWPSDIPVASR